MISLPRALLLALGALFSTYHVLLALFSLSRRPVAGTDVLAIAAYAAISIVVLWPRNARTMPHWQAALALLVSVALPLLVTVSLDGTAQNGYSTWYVAAVGTLLTVTRARNRSAYAWLGIAFLTVHTVVWAGPIALSTMGVVGSVVWVAVTGLLTRELVRATREAHALESAERAAAAWRAAEEAHLHERNVRLGQTRVVAAAMLARIVETGAELSEADRQECRYLEASVRDEIRGRRLLNDAVRGHIIEARRRGVTVSVLDDGGLDQTDGDELAAILDDLAASIAGADADRLIVRTGSSESPTAVTVVGLRTADDGSAQALGADATDDEVAVWVEIPRRGETDARRGAAEPGTE